MFANVRVLVILSFNGFDLFKKDDIIDYTVRI